MTDQEVAHESNEEGEGIESDEEPLVVLREDVLLQLRLVLRLIPAILIPALRRAVVVVVRVVGVQGGVEEGCGHLRCDVDERRR